MFSLPKLYSNQKYTTDVLELGNVLAFAPVVLKKTTTTRVLEAVAVSGC